MKNIFLLLLTVITLVGCSDEFTIDDVVATEALPPYVAFNPPGTSATIAPVNVNEASGSTDLNVEVPTNNQSNVNVTYTFSGTAVFGEDFTVDGADASGGTLTIEHKQTTNPDDYVADNGDITIILLRDGVADGNKSLVVTLTSAANDEGELAVGRGGTDALKSVIVNIADID